MFSLKENKEPILNWKQSKYKEINIPLYYVIDKSFGREVCSIELIWDGKGFVDKWNIRLFGNHSEIVKGTIKDYKSIQLIAEQKYQDLLINLSKNAKIIEETTNINLDKY